MSAHPIFCSSLIVTLPFSPRIWSNSTRYNISHSRHWLRCLNRTRSINHSRYSISILFLLRVEVDLRRHKTLGSLLACDVRVRVGRQTLPRNCILPRVLLPSAGTDPCGRPTGLNYSTAIIHCLIQALKERS